jgi:hypothetical protein
MMQELDRATFNNIEHLSLEFVTVLFELVVSPPAASAIARPDECENARRLLLEFRAERLVVLDVL